jgi:hypothetical protein
MFVISYHELNILNLNVKNIHVRYKLQIYKLNTKNVSVEFAKQCLKRVNAFID